MKNSYDFPTNFQNNCKDIKPYRNTLAFVTRACLWLGSGLSVLAFENWIKTEDLETHRNVFGWPGVFMAEMACALFAIAGFIHIYLRFWKQHLITQMQAKQIKKEMIGSGFFELVRLTRANVAKRTGRYNGLAVPAGDRGSYPGKELPEALYRQVFQAIKKQFFDMEAELGHLFADHKMLHIYEPAYLKTIKDNAIYNEQGIGPALLAKTDLLYLVVFFGIGSDGQKAIYNLTKGHYRKEFLQQFLAMVCKVNAKPRIRNMAEMNCGEAIYPMSKIAF